MVTKRLDILMNQRTGRVSKDDALAVAIGDCLLGGVETNHQLPRHTETLRFERAEARSDVLVRPPPVVADADGPVASRRLANEDLERPALVEAVGANGFEVGLRDHHGVFSFWWLGGDYHHLT